ncbi:hypothetical protein [Paraburkholderia sediminicola]|uniref:hypothetical protein n=1 Tax=Paraburkholderia sediminicola TaxID=458836 RepID=UPI0038B7D491
MQSRLSEAEIATFITQIENRGIDDIQIDVTDLPGGARDRRVREAGDARPRHRDYKLLAKIGSELNKPERLAFLTSHDLACRYSPGFSIWRRSVCSPWNPNANGGHYLKGTCRSFHTHFVLPARFRLTSDLDVRRSADG